MSSRGLARGAIAVALAACAIAWAQASQREVGLARDEVVYMHHGTRYADWWIDAARGEPDMLTADTITRHFGGPGATDGNREHPPLMKTLFGLSERLVHRKLEWTDRTSAYRLPSAVAYGISIALVYGFAASLWGGAVGLLAALLLLLLPRGLFHAGLATFDGAVVTAAVAVLIAYFRALGSRRWCLALGVAYGLALATKHNAWFSPAVLVPHYLWVSFARGRAMAGEQAATGSRARRWLGWLWRGALAQRPLIFPALFVLGPLVLIALWPWLWFDTFGHLSEWVRFHLHHVHYNFEYLGRNWNAPPYPWHVPVVTTLLTVPVVTALAALLGGGALALARWRRWAAEAAPPLIASEEVRGRAPVLLLVLSAAVAMGPFLTGRAPIFGAEKHWAAAMPALCILAALGLVAAARLAVQALVTAGRLAEIRARAARAVAIALLAAVTLAAAAVETARAQPYALSHYNALAGGAPGGADLGMNRQFWGYAARGVLPYLATLAPAPGEQARPVYTHDASPAWATYRSEGLALAGMPDAGHERQGVSRSAIALVIHERHFHRHDYIIWDEYGTVRPAYVLTFQGVPLVSVYVREP